MFKSKYLQRVIDAFARNDRSKGRAVYKETQEPEETKVPDKPIRWLLVGGPFDGKLLTMKDQLFVRVREWPEGALGPHKDHTYEGYAFRWDDRIYRIGVYLGHQPSDVAVRQMIVDYRVEPYAERKT